MADNYLEKRMEEYRAGRLAPRTRVVARGVVARREKGEFVIAFPQMRVVVLGGSVGLAEAVAKAFRTVDCQVALCHADSRSLTPFAQRHGLRYYPFDPAVKWERVIDDVTARWGGVDVVVDLRDCIDVAAVEVQGDAFSENQLSENVATVDSPATGSVEHGKKTDAEPQASGDGESFKTDADAPATGVVEHGKKTDAETQASGDEGSGKVAVEAPAIDDGYRLRNMTGAEMENLAELLLIHSHPKFGFVQSVDVGFEV